jgi:hypothetical protein
LLIVRAISLAAQGSDAPTADGADSSTTAVEPPSPVAVNTPSSRRRNVAVFPVREVIDSSLWLANIGSPRRRLRSDCERLPVILPSDPAPPPIHPTGICSHSAEPDIVAELLQLSGIAT